MPVFSPLELRRYVTSFSIYIRCCGLGCIRGKGERGRRGQLGSMAYRTRQRPRAKDIPRTQTLACAGQMCELLVWCPIQLV
jgi:hypothetical protein